MLTNFNNLNPCYGTTYIRHINGLYLGIIDNTLQLSNERYLWRVEIFEDNRFYLKDIDNHLYAEYWWGNFQIAVDSGYTEQHWNILKNDNGIILLKHADSNNSFIHYSIDNKLILCEENDNKDGFYFTFEDESLTNGYPYIEIKSTTNKIALRIEPEILNYANYNWLLSWANDLEKAVYSYNRLTGLMPFPTIEFRTHTNCNNWGYIYYSKPVVHINNKCMIDEVIRMRRQKIRDVSFGSLHELSHLFDKPDWMFDGEALANIKIPFILYEQGFKVCLNKDVELNYYNYADELYKEHGRLDNIKGLFCSSLAAKITEITYTIGWDAFFKTFRNFPNLENESKVVKFETFIQKLTEYSNKDVFKMFTDAEWDSVISNLSK